MGNKEHIILVFLLILSCSRYYRGDPFEQTSTVHESKFEICYELIGWEHFDYKIHAAEVLSSLHESKFFRRISSSVKSDIENRVQIILITNDYVKPLFGEHSEPVSWMVERKPGTTSLTFINRVLSYRTFLIFPYFMRDDNRITFRLWKGNRVIKDFSYSLNNVRAIGWLPLLARPFDDGEEIDSMYGKASKQFISDLVGYY